MSDTIGSSRRKSGRHGSRAIGWAVSRRAVSGNGGRNESLAAMRAKARAGQVVAAASHTRHHGLSCRCIDFMDER